MTATMNLTAATLTALAKTFADEAKKARKSLAPGEYAADATVTVEVSGTVSVSEDETYTPTTSVPVKAALALFMRYSGVTGPAAMDALTRAMTEAVAMGAKGAETIPEVADIEAAEAKVIAGLKALPPKSRAGKVRVKATLAEVTPVTESGTFAIEEDFAVAAE